jgi:hypothetical protein
MGSDDLFLIRSSSHSYSRLSPGDLLKYRLVTGVYYSGIFLGLTPVSQYQVMRLDVLVGEKKESVNVNTIIELEVMK